MKVKRMQKKCTKSFLLIAMSLFLTGCGQAADVSSLIGNLVHEDRETEAGEAAAEGTEVTEETSVSGITSLIDYDKPINVETGSMGLDPNDKDFMTKLVSGSFYVIHDGYYYPAFSYASNYDFSDTMEDYINPNMKRQMYFTEENELEIPTLFLANGDTLVYYDTENILDYVKWERYQDLGYTIGVYNIHQTDYAKLAYIDLEEDEGCIISGSSLEEIGANVISPFVSLIRIGDVYIKDDLVQNGLISGATAGESYDLEAYDGTNYNHYIATADMHAFQAYEMFASIETEPLQQFAWKVAVPDYFVNGYYKVNAICQNTSVYDGLIRIVVWGDSFINTAETFNEQLLYPYSEEQIAKGDIDESGFLYQYSECEELNKFSTMAVGTLGYDDGVEEAALEEKAEILRTANISTFNINFPKGETCGITITPSEKESGGEAYVLIGNKTVSLTYSAFDNTYSTIITGDGNTYTLYVSGFWNSYDIQLSNCKKDAVGESQSVNTNSLVDDIYTLDGYSQSEETDKKEEGKKLLEGLRLKLDNGTEANTSEEENISVGM